MLGEVLSITECDPKSKAQTTHPPKVTNDGEDVEKWKCCVELGECKLGWPLWKTVFS